MFAAANSSVVQPKEAIGLLLARDAWWLWSEETQREAFRLLAVLAPHLALADWDASALWTAILLGLPEDVSFSKSRPTTGRISQTMQSGCTENMRLEPTVPVCLVVQRAMLDELSNAHPQMAARRG